MEREKNTVEFLTKGCKCKKECGGKSVGPVVSVQVRAVTIIMSICSDIAIRCSDIAI